MKNQSNDSWDKIEENWKKKIQEKTVQPSDELWSKLDKKLSSEEKVKIAIISKNPYAHYWTWVAALFAIAIGLNWIYKFNQTTEIPSRVITKIPEKRTEKRRLVSDENLLVKRKQEKQVSRNIQIHTKAERQIENRILVREHIEISQNTSPLEQRKEILDSQTAQEPSEEVWMKISIDPLPTSNLKEMLSEVKTTEKKKKSLFKIITQLKNMLKGENNMEETSNNLTSSVHQVANTYYRTEEKLKQTFQ